MFAWPRLATNTRQISRHLKLGFTNKVTPPRSSQANNKVTPFSKLFSQPKSLLLAATLTLFGSNNSKKMSSGDSIKGVSQSVFDEADKIFAADKFDEVLELLKKQSDWESNEQVLWRVARAEYQIAKQFSKEKGKYTELVEAAYEHVKKSVELNDKNGLAHKWAAILLDAVSSNKGTKERVLQILNVRQHMEKAVEYAPDDATSYYLLGEWHLGCYLVSWWERKLANLAFGKLPDADIEVALKMFEKAEEVDKDFYSKNKLALAKVLFELKRDKERAISLLNEVIAKYSSSEKWDDKEAVEEANKLLKQHT